MHRCVAHTKVIAILILTYPHELGYGCCHFFVRQLDILFRISSASKPSNLSMETMQGKTCWIFWRQASRYIFFSPSLHHEYTSMLSLLRRILHQCLQHVCREHFRSLSYRVHVSEVRPSVPWSLASVIMGRVCTLPAGPLAFLLRDMHR